MIGEFPAQRASNVENISIWWRHRDVPTTEITFFCYFCPVYCDDRCNWEGHLLSLLIFHIRRYLYHRIKGYRYQKWYDRMKPYLSTGLTETLAKYYLAKMTVTFMDGDAFTLHLMGENGRWGMNYWCQKIIYFYDALSSLTMIDRQIYSIAKYFIKMKNIGGI